jgi:hypothetical protein
MHHYPDPLDLDLCTVSSVSIKKFGIPLVPLRRQITLGFNPKIDLDRFNSTLSSKLTKLFQSALRGVPTVWWPHCLDGIAKLYNFTVHSSTGTAPHVAKYDREIQADTELFIGDKVWFIPSGPKSK